MRGNRKRRRRQQETPEPAAPGKQAEGGKTNFFAVLLEFCDKLVYLLVGLCFVAAALISLLYGVLKFAISVRQLFRMGFESLQIISGPTSPPEVIITFVSDLLLTLIIMEVLGTVTTYLESRKLSLRPFLYIGIISATRGILAVGARLSVSNLAQLTPDDFRNSIVELGIDAAVIIALGVTINLIRTFLKEEIDEAAKTPGAGKSANSEAATPGATPTSSPERLLLAPASVSTTGTTSGE